MKALVTGATGFIGSHLVESLIRQGFEVVCLVRNLSRQGFLEGIDVEKIQGDCTDSASLTPAVKCVDYVFHLAGLTKAKSDKDFFAGNVIATKNMLEAVHKYAPNIERFFHLSSLAASGPSADGTPLKEDCHFAPVSTYGRTKMEGEKAVYAMRQYIPVTIIRPPAVYGPRDRDMFLFFQMVKRGIVPYWGNSKYSFLYVEDLVNGIIQSARHEDTIGEVFFLSDGNIYSSDDIIDAISTALQRRPLKVSIPRAVIPAVGILSRLVGRLSIVSTDRMKDIRHQYWVCDIEKAKKRFGFQPKVDMRLGAQWTADWYRIHQWI
jgi:nucleoside-diphosphate-sugar epimerase